MSRTGLVLALAGLVACSAETLDESSNATDDLPTSSSGVSGSATMDPGASTSGASTSGSDSAQPDSTGPGSTGVETAGSSSTTAGTGESGGQCLEATLPCAHESQCCTEDGLTCGPTTLGQVCCGIEGTPCSTPNGEDCCDDLLCVAGQCLSPDATPDFQAPFPCGESWTYSHHSQEVRRALDFIDNAGGTDGAPALAAAAGVATRHDEPGGAGNYIVIDHGGGWTTYYFHLQAFSVEDGTYVEQGQEVGLVGSTGASSGAHLHFEELRYGEGLDIWINGELLAPYPPYYGERSITSENCPEN